MYQLSKQSCSFNRLEILYRVDQLLKVAAMLISEISKNQVTTLQLIIFSPENYEDLELAEEFAI